MSQSFRFCPNCGTQNPKVAEECIKCGLVFSKFKPISLTIEKEKHKKSYFLPIILIIIGVSFLSYVAVIIFLEKEFLRGEELKPGIYNLTLRLENIYKKLPIADPEQKEKSLKEIISIEKLISTFPVSEDMEKINIFEENLSEIKNIIVQNKKLNDELSKKIEERFKKLK